MLSLEDMVKDEDIFSKENIEIDRYIVNSILEKYNYPPSLDLGARKSLLLLVVNSVYAPYKNDLFRLLEENNYSIYSLIGDLIVLRTRRNFSKESYVDLIFSELCDSFTVDDLGNCEIVKNNKKITFNTFTNFLSKIGENTDLEKLLLSGRAWNECHDSAYSIGKIVIPNSTIITSEMPRLYHGYFYHSYVAHNNKVYDFSNNVIYKKNEFDEFLTPHEIFSCYSSQIDDLYEKSLSDFGNNNYKKVLQLALNEKRKTYL